MEFFSRALACMAREIGREASYQGKLRSLNPVTQNGRQQYHHSAINLLGIGKTTAQKTRLSSSMKRRKRKEKDELNRFAKGLLNRAQENPQGLLVNFKDMSAIILPVALHNGEVGSKPL